MKRITIKIIPIIFIVLILSSCYQTPDSPIVISKKKIEFEENVEQASCFEEIPEYWEANYSKYNAKFKMSINADVIIPDIGKIQVAEIQPYFITITQADKIINAIFETLDVGFIQDELSRNQIEEIIIKYKAEQQIASNNGNEDQAEKIQKVIDGLYDMYENAPNEVEFEKYNSTFKEYEDGTGYEESNISVRVNPIERDSPIIEIYNIRGSEYDNGYYSSVLFYDINREAYKYGDEENRNIPYSEIPECNSDDAKKAILIANEYLSKMGIEGRILEYITPMSLSENPDEIVSYFLTYGKSFNNVLIKKGIQLGGSAVHYINKSAEDYSPAFSEEALYIEIQNEKIVYFSWSNFYTVKNILYEDVLILSFEDIMRTVESQLAVKYAFLEDKNKMYSLFVDKIIFSYAVEPIADTEFEYMLIPVWSFYGGYDFGEGIEQSNGEVKSGKYYESSSLLTVSAVDGSVIFGK